MPREAREKQLFSYYKVTQSCDQNVVIFKNKKDRMVFIETLIKTKEKYNFKLYGIAIKKSSYELLIYDNGSDISKIMKSINISFAMQYKCQHESCGVVFKERYKSDLLQPTEMLQQINKMPICLYLEENMLDVYETNPTSRNLCMDCYEKAQEKLQDLLESENLQLFELLKNKKMRNEWIKDFRRQSILDLSQIGQLFGGLSESAISKILNK